MPVDEWCPENDGAWRAEIAERETECPISLRRQLRESEQHRQILTQQNKELLDRLKYAQKAMDFIEALDWHDQCEEFWEQHAPVEDTAFWRCWETTMDEAQEYYEQTYAAVMAYYK